MYKRYKIIVYNILLLSILLIGGFILTPAASAQEQATSVYFLTNQSYLKVAQETTGTPSSNALFYAYTELDRAHSGSGQLPYAYYQIFWEQKGNWDAQIFLHLETRAFLTDNFFSPTFYAGAALTVPTPHGFIAIEPLYRRSLDASPLRNSAQLSLVGGWNWKHFDIATFNDFWSAFRSDYDFYSETRTYFKVSNRLELGANWIITKTDYSRLDFGVFGGVKWNF